MPAWLFSLLLLVLTRDGVLHRLDAGKDTTQPAPRATAMAVLDGGRVAILAGATLTVDGRRVPGKFGDLRALAGGALVWGATDAAVVSIDPKSGARATLATVPRLHRITAAGAALFAEADGVILEVGMPRRWKVNGRPVALAAGAGKLWVATKEGPLWEIDCTSGGQRDLKLGDWWGTLALAYGDGGLYAVTVAGKLWRIDPQGRTKTIVAMDGWQGAIDLSVLR
ncbi:MAG: hypothetical protein JWN44_2845 [Myxococcales bacterium]|nr:hypothetical protein [Myxococcales bacterium]